MQKVKILRKDIFLFRPELLKYWDLRIFLDVDFETALQIAMNRLVEKTFLGSEQEIIDKYKQRYIPGQNYISKR